MIGTDPQRHGRTEATDRNYIAKQEEGKQQMSEPLRPKLLITGEPLDGGADRNARVGDPIFVRGGVMDETACRWRGFIGVIPRLGGGLEIHDATHGPGPDRGGCPLKLKTSRLFRAALPRAGIYSPQDPFASR